MKTKYKLLALSASVLMCSLGVSGNVQADAYAISYTNIFNGTLTPDPLGSAQFFFPNTTTSQTSANLTGFASINNIHPTDAPNAALGVAIVENTFVPLGQIAPPNYSWADSQIVSQQTDAAGSTLQAVTIAEGNIDPIGVGSGLGRNASDTSFSIPFLVEGPTTLTFDFDAAPYMFVFLDALAEVPSTARAEITVNINIVDNTGNTVFNWSPNGLNDSPFGGVELSDPFSLNRSIARNFGNPGSTTFDPASNGTPTGNLSPASWGNFTALTNPLGDGLYTLTLQMRGNIDVTRQQEIPAPATLALIGLGMLGMGFTARCRRKQQA